MKKLGAGKTVDVLIEKLKIKYHQRIALTQELNFV